MKCVDKDTQRGEVWPGCVTCGKEQPELESLSPWPTPTREIPEGVVVATDTLRVVWSFQVIITVGHNNLSFLNVKRPKQQPFTLPQTSRGKDLHCSPVV